MRKKPTITMTARETAAETYERFLLTKCANGVKTKTIETYSQHFHAISKHLDISQEVAEMTAADLKEMVISMQESGLSPNSIKSYTITLKAFLSWCNTEGITTLNMAKYKGEETIKETYSDEELTALLQKPNMKKCSFAEYRSWAIVNLLVNCGCRAATIRNIQNRDVDLPSHIIHARHTKNRKALVIPLCSQMVNILREYMKIRGGEPEEYLFCSEDGAQHRPSALPHEGDFGTTCPKVHPSYTKDKIPNDFNRHYQFSFRYSFMLSRPRRTEPRTEPLCTPSARPTSA